MLLSTILDQDFSVVYSTSRVNGLVLSSCLRSGEQVLMSPALTLQKYLPSSALVTR